MYASCDTLCIGPKRTHLDEEATFGTLSLRPTPTHGCSVAWAETSTAVLFSIYIKHCRNLEFEHELPDLLLHRAHLQERVLSTTWPGQWRGRHTEAEAVTYVPTFASYLVELELGCYSQFSCSY